MNMKVYKQIARSFQAMQNCLECGNSEWVTRHQETIEHIIKNQMPSGSGVDHGTTFDFDGSTPNKLIFNVSFHHMNDSGMYDGWTDHNIIVTPDLAFGFVLRVTGRNRNNIKDHLDEIFQDALNEECKPERVAA